MGMNPKIHFRKEEPFLFLSHFIFLKNRIGEPKVGRISIRKYAVIEKEEPFPFFKK